MIMDESLSGFYGSSNELLELKDETLSAVMNQNVETGFRTSNKFLDQNGASSTTHLVPSGPISSNLSQTLSVNSDEDSAENCDEFSDVVLKYINQVLMEEDMEEKFETYQESAALDAAEQSFYELIGEKNSCSTSPPCDPITYHEIPDEIHHPLHSYTSSITDCDLEAYESLHLASQSVPLSFHASSNGTVGNILDGFVESPFRVADICNETELVIQFKRGFEEASRFLPNGNSLNVEVYKKRDHYSSDTSRGKKKNPRHGDANLEVRRSNKQSAVYMESTEGLETFDIVFENSQSQGKSATIMNGEGQQYGQPKGSSSGGKARGKRQGGKKDVVDLRTLLTLCAHAVAANDERTGNELLKQIRQHSSAGGDAMQRLAHYFSNGLEARMAGSGTQIYRDLIAKRGCSAEILKAYQMYLTVCPFKEVPTFFSNKTIMNVAEKAARLHIIDFGIHYGFTWLCLIRRLSFRPGGPPKLRITGIDLPTPGFRPAEMVEETGHRLAKYAETFRVPFEFKPIAQKWDTIQIEDLNIDRNEVLVVNCIHRLRRLLDETVMVESPKDIVLKLIRKINPDVFTLATVNGAYSAPFFLSRFREALFHFSTVFDMLEVTAPHDAKERMLIEKFYFGRQAMNVIACEGSERIERPETYKQWQVRMQRAGFRQLALNKEIMKIAKDRVQSCYHKDFVIDEDSQWMLLGWKGRISYALSSWRAASHS